MQPGGQFGMLEKNGCLELLAASHGLCSTMFDVVSQIHDDASAHTNKDQGLCFLRMGLFDALSLNFQH
jgi:hypothetical protein